MFENHVSNIKNRHASKCCKNAAKMLQDTKFLRPRIFQLRHQKKNKLFSTFRFNFLGRRSKTGQQHQVANIEEVCCCPIYQVSRKVITNIAPDNTTRNEASCCMKSRVFWSTCQKYARNRKKCENQRSKTTNVLASSIEFAVVIKNLEKQYRTGVIVVFAPKK
jgi:hypothetical protein